MEAICYIKTGMREVVLLLVCVSIRKAHISPISYACRENIEEKTNNMDLTPAVQWDQHYRVLGGFYTLLYAVE